MRIECLDPKQTAAALHEYIEKKPKMSELIPI
jgi:hypothetical protein